MITQEENKMKTVKYILGIIVTLSLVILAITNLQKGLAIIAMSLIPTLAVILFGHKKVFYYLPY